MSNIDILISSLIGKFGANVINELNGLGYAVIIENSSIKLIDNSWTIKSTTLKLESLKPQLSLPEL